MPRRPRLAAGELAYDVLNRPVGRLPLCAWRKCVRSHFAARGGDLVYLVLLSI